LPEVGWSDWGSAERILTSLKQMGKLEDLAGRLKFSRATLTVGG
jgi:hypothetical protein